MRRTKMKRVMKNRLAPPTRRNTIGWYETKLRTQEGTQFCYTSAHASAKRTTRSVGMGAAVTPAPPRARQGLPRAQGGGAGAHHRAPSSLQPTLRLIVEPRRHSRSAALLGELLKQRQSQFQLQALVSAPVLARLHHHSRAMPSQGAQPQYGVLGDRCGRLSRL